MHSPRLAMQMLIGLFFLSILQILYNYSQLPDTVAYHFGASGQADAWGSKTSFLLMDLGVTSFLVAVFFGFSLLVGKTPEDMISIPNRDYWLAPERKEETLRMTSSFILWMGALSLLFMRILFYQIYQVNSSDGAQEIRHFWTGFIVYLAVLSALIWGFFRAFRVRNA